MQSLLRPIAACVLASLCALPAAANECAEARQHLVIARRALEIHDYARAVAEYQASYEEDGDLRTLVLDRSIRIFDDGDAAVPAVPVLDDPVVR